MATTSAAPPAFVQRLTLARRCGHAPLVDLSGVLGDARALQQLAAALWRPFAQLRVAQAMALLPRTGGGDSERHSASRALAAALATARHIGYSEVEVSPLAPPPEPPKPPATRKRARRRPSLAPAPAHPELVCRRVARVDVGGQRRVQLQRQSLAPGRKVLLVADWVDEVESVLAAREAVAALGAEVVGVAFVAATSATLLTALRKEQLLFSCSWTPALGAEVAAAGDQSVTRSVVPTGEPVVVDYSCSCHQPAPHRVDGVAQKRKHSIDDEEASESAAPRPPFLTHLTAHYQGNNPSEDRSFNAEKSGAVGIRVNAVFDGHGGAFAVEHLCKTLCQRILLQVSGDASAEQVVECLKLAFAQCDAELKESLLALPAETHLSKGYCNSGACAAVALFVDAALYVANVGDCAVVIGRSEAGTSRCVATQLSVDHTCDNAEEIRLVLERSRDRNPIRLSKDDQANGGGGGGFGVKRVAGSLAVTRAFGDFYLKCEELSSAPFKSKLPYITVEPSVAAVQLDGSEKYLILGSDGLWEVLTPDEAAQIVDSFDPAHSLFFSSAAAALVHAALEKIAHRDGLMLHEVLALPPGPTRRRFHDDITCTVVYINGDERGERVAVESPPVGDIVSATPTAAANEESPPDASS